MLEVHDSGPVIGFVLFETASRAGCDGGYVQGRIHRQVEGILQDSQLLADQQTGEEQRTPPIIWWTCGETIPGVTNLDIIKARYVRHCDGGTREVLTGQIVASPAESIQSVGEHAQEAQWS